MQEVKGKFNTAKIFTDVVDETSVAQVAELCNQEFCRDSRIRLMPDIHAGAGCTVGTTITIKDKVVPNLVGVDIGCGMETIKISEDNLGIFSWCSDFNFSIAGCISLYRPSAFRCSIIGRTS